MNSKKLIPAVFTFVALLSVVSMAQERREEPDPARMAQHHVERYSRELDLTPAQQQQALTIFTASANSDVATHNELRSGHDSLKSAIKNNDAAAITQAANNLGSLMAQAIANQAKAAAAFRAILTPEQQAKFDELGPEFMMGPGGPGGPPRR